MHLSRARRGSAIRIGLGAGVVSVALVAAGQLSPTGSGSPGREPLPPTDLSDAVAEVFSSSECIRSDAALARISEQIDRLGFADWTVTIADGVRPGKCVGAGFVVRDHRILLMPAVSAALREAIDEMEESLLADCYDESGARQFVTGLLARADEEAWDISTDGPVGGPVDRFDEVMHHIDAGCYVYSGTGWTADGVRIIYLTGKR